MVNRNKPSCEHIDFNRIIVTQVGDDVIRKDITANVAPTKHRAFHAQLILQILCYE